MLTPKGGGKGAGAARAGPYTKPGGDATAAAGEASADEGRMIYVGKVPQGVNWQKLKDHMKQAGEVEFVQMLQNDWGKSRGIGFVRYATEAEAQQAIATLNGSSIEGVESEAPLEVDVWTGAKPRTNKGNGKGGEKGGEKGWKGAMMMDMMYDKGNGKGGEKGWKGAMMMDMMYGKGAWMPSSWGGGGVKGCGGKGKGGGSGGAPHDKSLKVWVGSLPAGAKWQELKDHFAQIGTVEFCNTRGSSGEVRFATAEEAQAAIETLNGSEFMGTAIVVDKWT